LGLGLDWNPPSSNVKDFLAAIGLLAEGGGRALSEERVYAVELGLSAGRVYAMGTAELGLSTGREYGIAETEDKGGG
jgi:hypothetical protein